MFHPYGPQPPAVYWRRRVVLLGGVVLLIVLVVLTAKAAFGSSASGSPTQAAKRPSPSASPPPASTSTSSAADAITPAATSTSPSASGTPSTGASSAASSPAAPVACRSSDMRVQAVTGASSYKVGDKPVVALQVTDTGSAPCVQDLADKQVVLSVYNGESRVWGSHDCQVQPGTADRTLDPNAPVRVAIQWSGLTSHPGCSGTRQRVGAGTYTLYASLAGHTGHAAQFTIG